MRIAKLEEFDAADYIKTEEDVLAYLNVVLEENDPSAFIQALGTIASSEVRNRIEIEALYQTLLREPHPQFATLAKGFYSLGFQFVLQPIQHG